MNDELWSFRVEDETADRIFLVCDCCTWVPMQRQGFSNQWEMQVRLPPGRHRLRYYRLEGETFSNAGSHGLIGERLTDDLPAVCVEAGQHAPGSPPPETPQSRKSAA